MCIGNGFSFRFSNDLSVQSLFGYDYGSFLIESDEEIPAAELIGTVTDDGMFSLNGESVSMEELLSLYEGKLEPVYTCNIPDMDEKPDTYSFHASSYLP